MINLSTAIFIVINSKGGVGKSTTSVEFVVPFLYKMCGFTEKKIKLFEVDSKNNTVELYKNSALFHGFLLKEKDDELKNVCIKEFSKLDRDYPLIFDIGVDAFDRAFEVFKNVVYNQDIIYCLPTKPSEGDTNNTAKTVEAIKKADPKANIIVFCTDSVSDSDESLKNEFGVLFGRYVQYEENKFIEPLFKRVNIPEKYVAIKKSELFIKAPTSYRTTIYDASLYGSQIHKIGEPTEIELKMDSLLTQMKALQKDPKATQADKDKLNAESEVLSFHMNFYKECNGYVNEFFLPKFKEFQKLINK